MRRIVGRTSSVSFLRTDGSGGYPLQSCSALFLSWPSRKYSRARWTLNGTAIRLSGLLVHCLVMYGVAVLLGAAQMSVLS